MILLPADSRQEAKPHGQSLQEAIYQPQQSGQEVRDRGQSRLKSNMKDILCMKRKLVHPVVKSEQMSRLT